MVYNLNMLNINKRVIDFMKRHTNVRTAIHPAGETKYGKHGDVLFLGRTEGGRVTHNRATKREYFVLNANSGEYVRSGSDIPNSRGKGKGSHGRWDWHTLG